MTTFTFIPYLLLVSLLVSSSAAATYSTTSISTPRISLQQLQSALPNNGSSDINNLHLHRLLHKSNGILRIAVDTNSINNDESFSSLRRRALSNLCNCPTFNSSPVDTSDNNNDNTDSTLSFEKAAQLHPKDLQQITLPDGSVRRTLASATIGFDTSDGGNILELPSFIQQTCGINTYNSFEDLRDVVSNVVDMFVQKLDNEKIDKSQLSYREILSDANHLEHFHVYTKQSNEQSEGGDNSNDSSKRGIVEEEEDLMQSNGRGGRNLRSEKRASTLDYHTDAGFFLSFVPAMDCESYTTDTSSFFLEGQDEPVKFEDDEIVIMMGAGAQYWLPKTQEEQDNQPPFLAASHALRLLPDTHRSWYGKMHLLPTSMTSSSPALSTFQLQDYDAHVPSSPVDGCGITTSDVVYGESSVISKQSRRRLQHVNSPANCNNVTNFFCWYQCINIPDSEHAEDYVYDGYSLYCLDPGLLSSSDNPIPDAVDKCKGGYVHNSNCQGSWQETDKTVPGYKLPYEVKKKEQLDKELGNNSTSSAISYPIPITGDKYCYGGTSMYMDGFTWQGTACVIYLFQSWVITTPGKFAAAAIGSIFFGIALECVLWKRRSVYAMSPGTRRLCLSALIYGLQLTMGYFIMLVIMTYSGPLFISTVSGMMIGHVIFNAQDSFVKKRMEKRESRRLSALDTGSTTYGSTRHMGEQESDSTCNELGSYQNGGNLKSPPEKSVASETTMLTSNKKLRSATADGATPCCQYSLDD